MSQTCATLTTRTGGCHCGAVRFEVDTPAQLVCQDCNCSICRRTGFIHLIVPRGAFRLLSGDEALTVYTFNTGIAQHLFCRVCGIKSFYLPRSNPDGVDVNLRCLDEPPPNFRIDAFDGQHWEDNAHTLTHLSATAARSRKRAHTMAPAVRPGG